VNKRKCRHCKDYFNPQDGIIVPVGFYCSYEHMREHTRPKAKAISVKRENVAGRAAVKAQKAAKKIKQKDLMTRTEWYKKLQYLVNQYIVQARDVGKPCFTCGAQNYDTKYHCGHYIHAGSGNGDNRTFIHMNLHKQCVSCNLFNGGMPEIYAQRITETYGLDKLEWLQGVHNHPLLKEKFPHWSDVEIEINRYRQLLRDNGLKPCK
jgi:hypothetical protein